MFYRFNHLHSHCNSAITLRLCKVSVSYQVCRIYAHIKGNPTFFKQCIFQFTVSQKFTHSQNDVMYRQYSCVHVWFRVLLISYSQKSRICTKICHISKSGYPLHNTVVNSKAKVMYENVPDFSKSSIPHKIPNLRWSVECCFRHYFDSQRGNVVLVCVDLFIGTVRGRQKSLSLRGEEKGVSAGSEERRDGKVFIAKRQETNVSGSISCHHGVVYLVSWTKEWLPWPDFMWCRRIKQLDWAAKT